MPQAHEPVSPLPVLPPSSPSGLAQSNSKKPVEEYQEEEDDESYQSSLAQPRSVVKHFAREKRMSIIPKGMQEEVKVIAQHYEAKIGQRTPEQRKRLSGGAIRKRQYVNPVDRVKGEGGGVNVGRVRVKQCKQGH